MRKKVSKPLVFTCLRLNAADSNLGLKINHALQTLKETPHLTATNQNRNEGTEGEIHTERLRLIYLN